MGCFASHHLRGLDSVRVRGDGRTAEMVTEQVGQSPARTDGDSGRTREIILRDRCPLHFIVLTHVVRGHTIDGGLDLLAVCVIDETRRRRAGH